MVPNETPAILFFLDDLSDDFAQLVEDIRFGHAQCDLVRDLEDIANAFVAFTVHPRYGEAEFGDALDDAIETLHHDQGRNVDGHACRQARTSQGRAGRKIAEIIAEGEIQVAFQGIVDLGSLVPDALEVEAWRCRLNDEVVVFVEHDGDGPVVTEQDAAVLRMFDMASRRKMFHYHHFPFHRR